MVQKPDMAITRRVQAQKQPGTTDEVPGWFKSL